MFGTLGLSDGRNQLSDLKFDNRRGIALRSLLRELLHRYILYFLCTRFDSLAQPDNGYAAFA